MPPLNSALTRPGIISIVICGGVRLPVGPCARCERVRALFRRGLCSWCRTLCQRDGTIQEYGWTKAEKIAVYAATRSIRHPDGTHPPVAAAAAAAGVTPRTGHRYEAELDAAGLAPWRVTDQNVIWAARRWHRQIGGA